MRVRDEELSVEASIRSILPALDELIITCQPSIDDTYKICQRLEKEFPKKIKLYYYTPEVVAFQGSHCFNGEIDHKDEHSVHNMAHYSNYGLVRINYKYYMKVDADQIYFTSKMMELREAVLGNDGYSLPKRSLIHKILGKILMPFFKFLSNPKRSNFNKFFKFSNILNANTGFSMGGVNLGLKTSDTSPNLEVQKLYVPVIGDKFSTYNGGSDTCFFIPEAATIYIYINGVEVMKASKNSKVFDFNPFGIFWLHTGLIKRNLPLDMGINIRDFASRDDQAVLKIAKINDGFRHSKLQNIKRHNIDRHYILETLEKHIGKI